MLHRCAVLLSLPLLLAAQTPPAFEVASIKPGNPEQRGGGVFYHPGGRFEGSRVQMHFLIEQLYGLRDYQVVDGPKWVYDWNAPFDIQAKAAGSATKEQVWDMARTLLADRFQLKFHYETRDLPVYALLPAKTGPKLSPAANHGSGWIEPVEIGFLRGKSASISQLVNSLSALRREIDRPVVDFTGFNGQFDFILKWAAPGSAPDDFGQDIFSALQSQLGLKLEPRKAPVRVLAIDRVEKPTEN
ncbi:MAG: TIGR03435 family protein [Acidobacteriia bacterium]|nr:TIGR03435 family protein [Terriglobia bacterium]